MIIPTGRLLWLCGLTLVPLAGLAAAAPSAAGVAGLAALALLLPVVLDAALAGRNLAGVGAVIPDLTRMTKGAEGTLELRLTNASAQSRRIRVGLPLHPDLACTQDELNVSLPQGARHSTISFECQPLRRGRYVLRRCYLGGTSPLGLWLRRKAVGGNGEIRVYPDLRSERRRLAALFLNRGGAGIHAQRQIGQGREFEKLRDYVHGDSYAEIHWKASAKRARPITKVFQVERTQEVYVVVDSSRLSGRLSVAPQGAEAGAVPTCLERFLTASLVMNMAAERQGDLVGLVTFSDRVDTFIRARNGKAHYRTCRDAIYALQPSAASPDFAEVFAFLNLQLRRRALLVILTSLDDPVICETFTQHVGLLSRRHVVLVNQIAAPGVAPLFTRVAKSNDDIYLAMTGHLQHARLREVGRALGHRGVRFSTLTSASFCADIVSQYLAVKQRQLL
jgi:uncharacterized protein (DUF58 family)